MVCANPLHLVLTKNTIVQRLLFLLGLLAVLFEAGGQVPTEQDCLGAIPVCQNVYVQTDAYSGEGNYPSELALGVGCNFAETNSVWYTFTIQSDGFLSFILDPVTNTDDYDWALFNLTDAECGDIGSDPSLEVSCNSYGEFGVNGATGISTAMGGTGNSNGPGNLNGPIFNADLPVVEGEVYALLVMDWSGTPTGYTLDFSNTSAGLFDAVGPDISSVALNCDNTIDVIFDENVLCGTLNDVEWELEYEDGSIVTAAGYTSDCTSDDGFVNTITLEFDQDIIPVGEESLSLTIIDDMGNITDFCGNEVATSNLVFDFVNEPMSVVPVTSDSDCDTNNGQVDASDVMNGQLPMTYDLDGTEQASPLFNGLGPGTYTLTVTDANQCNVSVEVVVGQPNPPIITAVTAEDIICGQGCTGTINIEAANILSYSVDGGATSQPTPFFTGLCEGSYSILVNAGNNCETASTATIGSTSGVEASMTISPLSASIYEPNFQLTNTSESTVEAQWLVGNFGSQDVVFGDSVNYTFDFPEPGIYDVQLIVTDTAGCQSIIGGTIRLLAEFTVFVPNSFTPNGDGVNDAFRPITEGIVNDTYLFEIFDRWGNIIFSTRDPGTAWHGEIKDGSYYPQPEVFQYRVTAEPVSSRGKQVFTGRVTMLR
jgi:gliding motility-associated-like protein